MSLPFLDGKADRLLSVHLFEHLFFWDVPKALAEWKRVLKPGGVLVIELPCMDKVFNHIFLRMKKGKNPSPSFSWLALWGDPKYQNPAMCHKWGYFKHDMVELLTKAGFEQVKDEEPNYHFPTRDMRFTAVKPFEFQDERI